MSTTDQAKKRAGGELAVATYKHIKQSPDDFKLVMLDATSFRRVLESYQSITHHTSFKVVKSGERWLLEARGEDHSHTCIVAARILIDDEDEQEDKDA